MTLEKNLDGLLQNAAAPLTLADATAPDCPLLAVNRRFEVLTGYRSSEVVGQNCRFLQTDIDQSGERQKIRDALTAHVAIQVVLMNRRKNDEIFANLLFLFPIFSQGACAYFLGSQFALEGPELEGRSQGQAHWLMDALERVQSNRRVVTQEHRRLISESVALSVESFLRGR